MKVRFNNNAGDGFQLLPFTADGAGQESAIVNIKPLGSEGPSALNKVTVSSSAETSKNGVRRVLIKVSMPYMALDPNSAGTGNNLLYSPTRSGRTLSAHVVFTLPREAVEDLKGQRVGSNGTLSAANQLVLINVILTAIARVFGNGGHDQLEEYSALPVGADSIAFRYVPETNTLEPSPATTVNALVATVTDVTGPSSAMARALLGSVPLDADVTHGEAPVYIP